MISWIVLPGIETLHVSSKTLAVLRAGGGDVGRHVPVAAPGPFMVVLMQPAVSLGGRYLDFSQLTAPSGSLFVHARAARLSLFLAALPAGSSDADAMAVHADGCARGALGNI